MTKEESYTIIDLVDRVSRIENKVENLITEVSANTVVVSNLILSQARGEGVRNYIDKRNEISWKKAGICISAILGFSGIIITCIFKFI